MTNLIKITYDLFNFTNKKSLIQTNFIYFPRRSNGVKVSWQFMLTALKGELW